MSKLKLASKEKKFADIIWKHAPIKSKALSDICEKELEWKRTTTYTVLKKVCEKGIFSNNNGIVEVIISKEDFAIEQADLMLEDNFSGSLPNFLVAFTKKKKLTNSQIAELQNLIDQHKEE